jgi:exopolysaccharide production protein ExoZ
MTIKKFDSLQIYRGLAALGVIFHHLSLSVNTFVDEIPGWLYLLFNRGFLGVDFFFVLSGFIIMSSHFDDEKSVVALKSYGFKRFVRIFPPYWPISIALLVAYAMLPGFSQGVRNELSLVSSILLLPDINPPALSVAWTLIHEMMFYIIFCLFFIKNRLFLILMTVWIFSIFAMFLLKNKTHNPILMVLLNPINLDFVLGMLVAFLARKLSNRFAIILIFFGITIFSLLLFLSFSLEYRFLFGIPFSLLVLGTVLLERQRKLKFPHWMVLIGDASYSIYLVHNPLVGLTSRLVGRFPSFGTWGVGMLIGTVASILIGVLYHLTVEKPLIRVFRKIFGDKSRSNSVESLTEKKYN